MKNLCKWGVVQRGFVTASGYDELHAAFKTKKEAVEYLKTTVPIAPERRHRWKVERLVFDEPVYDPRGCVLPEMHDGPCQYAPHGKEVADDRQD
jgi:hypothetical protein